MLISTNFQSVAFQVRVEGSVVDFCASAEGRVHSTFGVKTRRSQLLHGVNFGEQVSTYSEETVKQGPENFLEALSNSSPAVRRYSEGGNRPTGRTLQETS
jgi:hypothetical protein